MKPTTARRLLALCILLAAIGNYLVSLTKSGN